MRKVVLYVALSLDGYIDTNDDDISLLDLVTRSEEDYDYSEFMDSIDTIIIGRRTYERVLFLGGYPHRDKKCYVLTSDANTQPGFAIQNI